PAMATQRYAAPGTAGSGTDCTQTSPCSLDFAVTLANSGDEVIVTPGAENYVLPGTTSISVPGGVTVHGADGEPRPTVVSSSFTAPLTAGGPNVVLRHLALENSTSNAVEMHQGIVVRDVIAHSTGGGSTACFWVTSGTLTDSLCWASNATNTRGAGANVSGFTVAARLRNVTAIGNNYGLEFSVNNSATASTVDAKNVIAMQAAEGPGTADVYASASGAATSMTVTMDHSNYDTRLEVGTSGGTASVTDPGTNHNQIDAPVFVGATGDFHEASNSPTINAGADDPFIGPVDFDGDQRFLGTAPDIGADEFNADPVANDDVATVPEDEPDTPLSVLGNDTNDGDQTTVESTTDPAHGTAFVESGGADVHYQPDPDYCGPDSLTYTLNGGDSAVVSITVTCVDDDPVAVGDSVTVAEDAGATAIDVLANDTDIDGGPMSVGSKSSPAHGTATITGGGSAVSYQPAADYCGADSFTYTLNGGSTATVTINVTCVDDPIVDTLAPGTSLRKKPAKVTRKRKAKFRFASTEAGSTFLCKLDRKPYRPCLSPATFTVRPGKHRLRVKAVDAAGNVDATPASYRWKVLPPP
ncbi:MAG TPA: Ig-like domain-containing protein, partial [Solirubrobacterales bacterium]|nr:Ig-like domain-containing protein [Solirubrobacterales bacterium]